MDFITIDFETATSGRDAPCEIGLTFVENSKIIESKSWLINPEVCFNPFNFYIHGISEKDVENEPTFPVIWKEVLPLIEGKFLIAHNAAFDMSVLRGTLERYNIPFPTFNYACSYIFSKNIWGDLSSYSLKYLCHVNSIRFKHHRAKSDSLATAELCLKGFEKAGITSLEELPKKLEIIIGEFYLDGYKPCQTIYYVERKNIKKVDIPIVGDYSKINPDSIFYEKTVCFTGVLSSMPRCSAQQIIADIGGILVNSVTMKTDFLIVGQQDYRIVGEDGMSNKQEKAVKLLERGHKIEVLSEEDFLQNI